MKEESQNAQQAVKRIQEMHGLTRARILRNKPLDETFFDTLPGNF